MSTYYNMSVSHTIYTEIYDAILTSIKNETNTWGIIDLVHLLDTWEELMEEASAKNSAELQKWAEQRKLFEKREVDDIFLFHKIKNVLKQNSVEKNIESEFYLICDLADLFEEEWKERTEEEQ